VISGVASNPGEIGEGGGATVLVQAKQPGVDGNLFVARGSEFGMTMSSSYAGIDQRAILHPPGLAGGTDTETCEELRARLIALRRQPVTSGNLAFYDAAVRSFPGVQRVCFSGCKCANCQCGPIVGIYPFFDAGVYPPYGVPPSLVNDDILTYVFGENNGAGEGLAPIGAIGQVMCAQPAMLSVNVYTTQNVNPQLHAVIRSAIVEFFNTVSCVGERFCLSALQQSITVTVPRICIRAVHVCGDDATMADGMVKVACGKFPVVERVSVQARTPPTVPCST
jgi:hypothetical protein